MTATRAPAAESRISPHSANAIKQEPRQGEKLQPFFGFIPPDYLFIGVVVGLLAITSWPLRWILSGAPLLTYVLIAGARQGNRILGFVPLWTLILLLNLSYAVVATSWILYWLFAAACYPAAFLASMYQSAYTARFVRRRLRSVLRELHFTNDVVAFFDLPALEVDVDVEGLMCIRGLSISFSSLSIIAYGVEVGIKLSQDLEIALVVDQVHIRLFRRIDITDVYGNIKGGLFEMTFGKLAPSSKDDDGDSIMVENTPLLISAAAAVDGEKLKRPGLPIRKLTEHMTGGTPIKDSSVKDGLDAMRRLSPEDEQAGVQYEKLLKEISSTSVITVARKEAQAAKDAEDHAGQPKTNNDIRASICSLLHDQPTIAHPAKRSIKVSALQHLSPPHVRRFLHRLPFLLRLLLNPIAYFHPVFIDSITVGGSGRFLHHVLSTTIFPADSEDNIKNLKQRITSWLTDANFVFELADVAGQASVPINTIYDIVSSLTFDDVMAYRTQPKQIELKQIVRLAGADARITLPSFLLPHHEHLLPAPPTKQELDELKIHVDEADSKVTEVQAQQELNTTTKDEVMLNVSAHIHLPAAFDQELLDFIAALVKATKIVEMEREDPVEKETRGFRSKVKGLGDDMLDSMRRVALDAAANDRWIAKLVGKVTKKLEIAQGDVGYSGDFPIPLDPYRQQAEEASKILP